MFEILFGWRKASRCKKLIRRVQCRLKLLRNKRESIIRQLRQDVVQLIKSGHQDSALSRIEQLYKDQNIKAVYDLLDNFCEFIIINLPYIRRHRDCPNDINEAVSSLLYASARCGDLPELIKLRVLFSERYGQKFALAAVELSLGNLVNRQMIENLCVKLIQDDLKLHLLKEVARDNGIELNYPDNHSEIELQLYEEVQLSITNSGVKWIKHDSAKDVQFTYDGIDESNLQISYDKEIEEIAKENTSIPENKKAAESPGDSFQVKLDSIGALVTVEESMSRRTRKSLVSNEKFEVLGSLHEAEILSSIVSSALVPQNIEKIAGTGSDSPSRFSERSIVYLDDVVELEPSMKDVKDKNQRLFMLKSNVQSQQKSQTALTISRSAIHEDDIETFEPSDGKSSSRSSSKRRHLPRKELKSRYVLVKNLSMKDAECALYYDKTGYSSSDDDLSIRSSNQRKHQRNMNSVESPGSNHKKISLPKSPYFYEWILPEDRYIKKSEKYVQSHKGGEWEITDPLQSSRAKASKKLSSRSPQKQVCPEDFQISKYSSDEAFSTNVKTNPRVIRIATNKSTIKPMEEAEVIDCHRSCASSHDSSSRVTSPWTHVRPPYLRALTMPAERPKETSSYEMRRSASHLPDQQSPSNLLSPSYVHPKLPEYDDLEAKFRALKKHQSFSTPY